MKLLYDLPESEMKIVSDATGGAEILFCTPFDLTMDYNYTDDGWLVLTRGTGLILLSGAIIRSFSVTEGQSYRSTSMLSNGYLEGTFDDEPEILVRYSNEHLARYSYIVKALNSLSRSAETKIKSVDDEMKCPICGRRFAFGVRKCPVCTKKTELFKKLIAVAKPYWHIYILAILLFISGTALTLYLPMLNRDLIDHSLTAPFPKTIYPLLYSIGMIAIFNFLSSFNGAFRARVLVHDARHEAEDVRQVSGGFSRIHRVQAPRRPAPAPVQRCERHSGIHTEHALQCNRPGSAHLGRSGYPVHVQLAAGGIYFVARALHADFLPETVL
jgi:hypothetical protein